MVAHAEDQRQRDTLGAIKAGARINFDSPRGKAGHTSCFPRVDGGGGIGILCRGNSVRKCTCTSGFAGLKTICIDTVRAWC